MRTTIWMLSILIGSFAGPLLAQAAVEPPAVEAQTEDVLGWHIVQPGENFQIITRRYLGTARLWAENWRLNPQIRDPGSLRVGQRIRVIVERQLPARRAVIEEVANAVDKNLQRSGWQGATDGDSLGPRDGVRTLERASTRLGFDDGSQLTLTELSQVFLKDLETTLSGVQRGAIEVRQGQAELLLKAPRPDRVDIEIIVGDSVTRPRPGPAGTAQTRSRLAASGGAQLMVYGGSSKIEAGGAAVDVPRGMGTNVPEGGAPSPPEKLLSAPVTGHPVTGNPLPSQEYAYANPRFTWRPVANAAAYVVEICHDVDCGRLVARVMGLTEPTWHPEGLPMGGLFWRVTAVSASGLDGYPSRAVSFAILSDRVDLDPPVAVAALVGQGHVADDGTLVLGRGATVRLEGRDDASGVADVGYRWTGGSWQSWPGRDLTLPDDVMESSLEIQATDQLGRTSQIWSVAVRRDETPPDVPTILGSRLGEPDAYDCYAPAPLRRPVEIPSNR